MKNNKEKLTNYANAIYQNAMVGVQSIRDIMDKVQDFGLKKELEREANLFNDIAAEVRDFAHKNKIEVKENNFMEKTKMWVSINMTTMFDKTTRHIAEMMLLGTVMGLTTIYKDKFDHAGTSEELDGIIEKLEKVQDNNYLELKKFLKNINN